MFGLSRSTPPPWCRCTPGPHWGRGQGCSLSPGLPTECNCLEKRNCIDKLFTQIGKVVHAKIIMFHTSPVPYELIRFVITLLCSILSITTIMLYFDLGAVHVKARQSMQNLIMCHKKVTKTIKKTFPASKTEFFRHICLLYFSV